MILRGRLTLYKTQLDPNYKNVYDGYDSFGEYSAFLSQRFAHIDINIPTIFRSRKDINGNFSVEIPNSNSWDLHDYNYAEFSTGSAFAPEQIYAFITSVTSLNDGATSSSTLIECKVDAWTMHYLEMREKNPMCKHMRLTYDQYRNHFNKVIRDSLSATVYPTNRTYIKRASTYLNNNSLPFEATVLWQVVEVNENADVRMYGNHFGELDTPFTVSQAIPFIRGNPKLLYIPVAVINCETQTVLIREIKEGVVYNNQIMACNDYDDTHIKTLDISTTGNGSELLESEAISRSFYTFFPPFKYDVGYQQVEAGGVTVTLYDKIAIKPSAQNSTTITYQGLTYPVHYVSLAQVYTKESPPREVFTGFTLYESGDGNDLLISGRDWYGWQTIPQYEFTFKDYLYAPQDLSNRYALNNEYQYRRSEYNAGKYPFSFWSLRYARKEFPISPSDTSTQVPKCIIRNRGFISPSLEVWYGGYVTFYDKTASNGSLYISRSSIEAYETANQSKILTSAVTGAGKAISGAALGVATLGTADTSLGQLGGMGSIVGSGVGAISGVATQIASWFDAKRQYDMVIPPVSNAIEDIYEQDEIFFIYNTINIMNENSMDVILDDLHMNGIVCDKVESPFILSRDFFDVNQVASPDLNGIHNAEDKAELNSAFARGITRWHIDRAIHLPTNVHSEVQTIYKILTEFNKSTPNYYRSWIEEKESQL